MRYPEDEAEGNKTKSLLDTIASNNGYGQKMA